MNSGRTFLLLIALLGVVPTNKLGAMNTDAQAQANLDLAMQMIQKSGASDQELLDAKTCGICRDDFTVEDNKFTNKLSVLRCNPNGVPHIFHKPCLHEWVLINPKCPMCQADLSALKQQLEKDQRIKLLFKRHNPLSAENRKELTFALAKAGVLNGALLAASLRAMYTIPNPAVIPQAKDLILPTVLGMGKLTAFLYLQGRYLDFAIINFLDRALPEFQGRLAVGVSSTIIFSVACGLGFAIKCVMPHFVSQFKFDEAKINFEGLRSGIKIELIKK